MSCLNRSIYTSILSICPHHHRSGRLHRLFPSLLHLACTRSVQPIMCDPLGSRDIHRQGLGAFLLATGLLASCCVASSRRNISPMCPLHHCSYNVIPHGSTIVLRNLCCAVHPHKVFLLLIRSSPLFWSATYEREAATDPVHEATVAEPPTPYVRAVEHPLSPGLLAIKFDASARALLLYPAQPGRQCRHLIPTYFVGFDNRMLRRHLLPRILCTTTVVETFSVGPLDIDTWLGTLLYTTGIGNTSICFRP
jgi:hypothetical protein